MPQTNGIPTTTQDKINAMDGFCLFSIFYFVLNTFLKISLIQKKIFITIVLFRKRLAFEMEFFIHRFHQQVANESDN
jgi:hypothetical protein